MKTRNKVLIGAAGFAALVIFILATRGVRPAIPVPSGSFAFAVVGDAPYNPFEQIQFRQVLAELNLNDLSFVIHVGDIFWRPCSDEHYREARGWLNGLRHPVIYTPGDNEWIDCWEPRSGGFAPQGRLASIRNIYFSNNGHSLGGAPIPLATQGGNGPYAEFVENSRWAHEGYLFATVHLVGSGNATEPFPGRTAADDDAARRRTEAAAAWLRETFAEARATNAAAVVIGCHAWMNLEGPPGDPYRQAYEPFLTALEEETESFGKPVLLVHGDFHEYLVDHPLVRRTTGRTLDNFTRLQVPGSPRVGWVRVVVTPGASEPFAFQQLTVPRWKYW